MTTKTSAAPARQDGRRRGVLAFIAGAGAAVLLAALAALTVAGDGVPSGSIGPSPTTGHVQASGERAGEPAQRRTFVNLIAREVTAADVPAIVGQYAVVVLNDWDREVARLVKQADPAVTVLMYQCLSSTRSSDRPGNSAGGVLYGDADPRWFAVDRGGERIEWDGYDGHWQMTTWDPDYQRAWVDSVLERVAAGPWDGVLADNDLHTLEHYSSAVLEGTGSHQETDRLVRGGLDTLVRTAGRALSARGKLLVPNISEGRFDLDRWRAHSSHGGGMEENFVHFGTAAGENLVGEEWSRGSWSAQARQVATPGLTLAVTQAAPDDHRSMLYGYASLLAMGDADSYWMTRVGDDTYEDVGVAEALPEAQVPVGAPLGDARRQGKAWVRRYERVWVAVNPTPDRARLDPPAGARFLDGSRPERVDLGPHTGVVLVMP